MGGGGDDTLYGGTGNDLLYGGDNNDTLNGGDGDDRLDGGAGTDIINGGADRDVLIASGGTLVGKTISNVEVLETQGGNITGTAAQFDAFDTIIYIDQPGYEEVQVSLTLSGAGTVDLSDELGLRGVTLTASAAGNSITTGAGNDTISGDVGNDVFATGSGNDLIYAGSGNDSLYGGADDDTLYGGLGNDTLDGGLGNDLLDDTQGTRGTVLGGDGDDLISVAYTTGGSIDGGIGRDVLYVAGTSLAAVTVAGVEVLETRGQDVTATAAQFDAFETITYYDQPGYEDTQVTLTLSGAGTVDLSDELGLRGVYLTASAAGNSVTTGVGNDSFYGGIGNDVFYGGIGNDIAYADAGNDSLFGGGDEDSLFGGTGIDLIDGGVGNDLIDDTQGTSGTVLGGNGDDNIRVTYSAGGSIDGGIGRDVLNIADGTLVGVSITGVEILETYGQYTVASAVQFDGFDAIEVYDQPGYEVSQLNLIIAGAGTADLSGELGLHDTSIQLLVGGNTVTLGVGNDYIQGSAGNDTVAGGDGADYFTGDAGDDAFAGGAGNDTFYGGQGHDLLDGGQGNDTVFGEAGNDTLVAGTGNDTLNGGADTDTARLGGLSSSYSFAGTVTSLTATSIAPSVNGIKLLTNMEFVQFDDGVFAVGALLGGAGSAPVITSNGGGATAAIAVAENGTAVTTVTATDADPGTTLSYAITGGADAASFVISGAGVLSFISAPNVEAPTDTGANNVYDVTVQVSDGTLTDSQAIAVTVTNLNEAPTVTLVGGVTAGTPIVVAENTPGSFVTVTATDPEAQVLTWSIGADPDASFDNTFFTIDPATGALRFTASPDFEFTDPGNDDLYKLRVTVTDSGGQATFRDIFVSVTNVNEAPVITSNGGAATAAITVAENTSAVTTVLASDPDAGAILGYGFAGGADVTRFAIDSATGALSFIAAPDFEQPGDLGANNVYEVVVAVTDGLGQQDTQTLSVTVTNANEAPVITSNGGNPLAVTLAENTSAVTTVTATDPDAGTTLTYALSGADAVRFAISSAGVLSFVAPPNFEAPTDAGGDNVYDLVVTTSDGTLSDAQTIAVTVTDVPGTVSITSNGAGTAAAITRPENGTAVTTVTASVTEAAGPLVYAISGGVDATRFSINAATGVLTFVGPPNFEVPTDSGGDNVYDVVVSASNGGVSDTQAIAVTVTNVNEAPVITSNGGAATATPIFVAENTSAVTTVVASDPDAGTTLTYAISGGADAARFSINAATGALRFIAAPNFEVPGDVGTNNVYDVIVRSSDGTLTDTQALAVTVTNSTLGLTITGTAGNDTISATQTVMGQPLPTEENDVIQGLGGNDTLSGGAGNDVLLGGAGNDTYILGLGDTVTELTSQGTNDTVISTASTTLGANVERLILSGAFAINGTGTAAANTLIGNGAANILNGGGGIDTLLGGLGNDTYVTDGGDTITEAATAGTDRVISAVTYTLGANLENLTLSGTLGISGVGNTLSNTIIGNGAANTLNGGGGIDTLTGGAGNDLYISDGGEIIVESAGGGTADVLATSASFVLAADDNIERMQTTSAAGVGAINLTGNALGQSLIGNAGANRLNGLGGNDTLNGGAGADVFVFTSTLGVGNIDRILGFVTADQIQIDNAVFVGLTAGALTGFAANATATAIGAAAQVVYETDTGALFFDSNGTGAGGRTQFATVDIGVVLTASEFTVV